MWSGAVTQPEITDEPEEEAPPSPEAAPLSPRAERKLAQVIEGARAVIVAKGFEGASVDDIAREAGISKATMYRYFPDKSALFQAVMNRECLRQAGAVIEIADCCGPVGDKLLDFARRHLAFVLSDNAIDAFRTAVAESARFPDLARDFIERRMDKARTALVPLMTAAGERGELAIDDPDAAARCLLALCKSDLFFNRLFGVRGAYSPEEIDTQARSAVAAFLRIYRPDPPAAAARR
jgi:TetR/AcrR family transcriptional regulator, mexJK operon transcriptional repressor